MIFRKKTSNFVSDIDRFLDEFSKNHPRTEEQLAEFKKYQHIYALRDGISEKEEA